MSVTIIAPTYQYFPILVPSLLCQTDPNWTLMLCHDGPNPAYDQYKAMFNDKRITWNHSKDRVQHYGHPIRAELLKQDLPGRYTIISNGDNYFMPHLIQSVNNCTEDIVAWGCSHSYWDYHYLPLKLKFSSIDVSSVAVRTDIAKEIGWPGNESASDYVYVQRLIEKTSDWKILPGIGFVHN